MDISSRNYDACGSPTKWAVMLEKKRGCTCSACGIFAHIYHQQIVQVYINTQNNTKSYRGIKTKPLIAAPSCPVLSCHVTFRSVPFRTVPSRPVPFHLCPVEPVPVASFTVVSCPVQSRFVLSCPVLSCPILSCPVRSRPVPFCPVTSRSVCNRIRSYEKQTHIHNTTT